MADKQKLTKGKRAVPYSKKKAPAKKTANEEPADEQYVDIDHYDYTYEKIGKWFHVLGGKKADERL